MNRAFIFGLCAIAIFTKANGLTADEEDSPSRVRIFTFIDRFNFQGAEKLPFVRVASGRWVRYDDDPPQNTYQFGFLENAAERKFTVRYLDLSSETLTATHQGVPEHERVGYESYDLAQYAREFAKRLVTADDDNSIRFYLSPYTPMDPRGEALVLARVCARRGLHDEVDLLFKAVGSAKLALDEFAEGARTHLMLEFANPLLTRENLLQHHERWRNAFPAHRYREFVDPVTEVLRKMAAEDKVRQRQTKPQNPSNEQIVADLIYSLRDEYYAVQIPLVDGYFVPSATEKPEAGKSPSDRLRMLGHKAVPALIEALSDDTLTRTVWYSSRYGGGMWNHGVASFASDLLEDISGLRFYGDNEERQVSWRQWWKTVSENGEEAALAEIAATGEATSEAASKRLLERWPERTKDVIEGIQRTTNRYWRQNTVKVLCRVKSEAVTEFLRDELTKGPYIGARVDAAEELLNRGIRDGVELFVREWATVPNPKEARQPGGPEAVKDFDFAIALGDARKQMAKLLLASGNLEAIRTVGRGLMTQPEDVRHAILETLEQETLDKSVKRADPSLRPEIEREFERMLGELLEDAQCQHGPVHVRNGAKTVRIDNPLAAELAAIELAELWPNRYRYDPQGPTRLRIRRLSQVKNAWRKEFGLDQLDVPPRLDLRSKDPAIAQNLQRFIESGEQDRKKYAAQLESVGIGAIAWIEDRLRELPEGHAARPDLVVLADRLSNVVREGILESAGQELPTEFKDKLHGLKGKRLDSDLVIDLLVRAVQVISTGTGSVILIADRIGDGNGITVSLKLDSIKGQRGSTVSASELVLANDRTILSSGGSGILSAYSDADDYKQLRIAIAKALATAHDKTFEIRVEIGIQ